MKNIHLIHLLKVQTHSYERKAQTWSFEMVSMEPFHTRKWTKEDQNKVALRKDIGKWGWT